MKTICVPHKVLIFEKSQHIGWKLGVAVVSSLHSINPLCVGNGLDPRPEPGAGLGQHSVVHFDHHLLDG